MRRGTVRIYMINQVDLIAVQNDHLPRYCYAINALLCSPSVQGSIAQVLLSSEKQFQPFPENQVILHITEVLCNIVSGTVTLGFLSFTVAPMLKLMVIDSFKIIEVNL